MVLKIKYWMRLVFSMDHRYSDIMNSYDSETDQIPDYMTCAHIIDSESQFENGLLLSIINDGLL